MAEASEKTLYEPEGMHAVRAKYAELGGVVSTFSEKVGDVLARAEVQFLQAYRGHMQEVRVQCAALGETLSSSPLETRGLSASIN